MEKYPYGVSIHGTVHGWSICIVAVYMYGVKLLTNEFRRMSTVKTPEQREAILEHKEPGGGTRHNCHVDHMYETPYYEAHWPNFLCLTACFHFWSLATVHDDNFYVKKSLHSF